MTKKRITVWVQRFKDRTHLVLQWIEPHTGQRKSKSARTDDEKEADQARADLEYELNNGKYQEASRMAWDRFRELFEAEFVAGKRPNTRNNYEDTLNLFEELCKPSRLRGITERTLSLFVASMRQRPTRGREGMNVSTMKVHLQFLRTALRWAVSQKMLSECPKFPSLKVPKKKPQPIPAESFERLLAKAPDDMTRVYLLVGWLAGLRLSEAFSLEWEPTDTAPYVDLPLNRIVLPAEFAKSVEDQWVPLDPILRVNLEALPRAGKTVFRFVDKRNGKPISESAVSDRVSRLAKLAGVKLTMHSLRKGFGCRYAGRVSAHVLQRLMRHSSIKTTLDYYANIDTAVMEAVIGPERNTSRNTPPQRTAAAPESYSTTDSQD